jgi:ribonuclease E
MSADADHEVIDSPEALFRHLYEEHGVEEARDLDPETAPLQFWLRRHDDLERAQRAADRRPEPPADRDPEPEARSRPEPRPQPPPRSQPQPPPAPRRHPGFRDPLVEAVARTLAGRGHDEAAVRSAIRSFEGTGAGPAGEAGVRAAFVEPMLRSVAEHLLGAGGSGRSAFQAQPTPAAPPPQPAPAAAREEPARPEAAWAVLWADLADPGRRAAGGAGAAADDGDDLMAVANAIQGRRRVKRLRR